MLSICIPSYNRANYLLKALNSIYSQNNHSMDFEVCISNNCSSDDYSKVEDYIDEINQYNIRYIIQKSPLSIDDNMHYVTKMARGDYIYFLGDDDYFYSDAFNKLEELLLKNDVDLATFNATIIDASDNIVGSHFNIAPDKYDCFDDAFLDLCDKTYFGAVLVKRKYLSDNYFNLLAGSSHAYCCFWLNMLNREYWNFNIIIPDFPCVYMRRAEKFYNLASVHYNDIFIYFKVFHNSLKIPKARKLNEIYLASYIKKTYSIRFMVLVFRRSAKFNDIYISKHNELIYVNPILFFIKKLIARVLSVDVVYYISKFIYKKFRSE
ncbi:TPA: glycosyltransferase family 2 protein [Yersinia enterocolitica]|uniref:glycosyltransferase family 2 protein n=1 Tax=Yersinia enterocolitica TaxID=630 RepID=UPI0005E9E5C5|nr:glycosyltransferase family 2 protein [Yersinia enterocolitica]CQJ56801.1 putative 6-deoxy-D-Gul transferase [Yersinia enterocolitica]